MPYRSQWYIPNKILYSCFWGTLTAEELSHYVQDVKAHYDEQDNPIHIITDGRDLEQFPASIIQLANDLRSMMTHPKLDWIFLINNGKSPLMKFISTTVSSILDARFKNVQTFEEALIIIRKQDPNVDWSQADESALTTP